MYSSVHRGGSRKLRTKLGLPFPNYPFDREQSGFIQTAVMKIIYAAFCSGVSVTVYPKRSKR